MNFGDVGWEQGGGFEGPEGDMTGGSKIGQVGASTSQSSAMTTGLGVSLEDSKGKNDWLQ